MTLVGLLGTILATVGLGLMVEAWRECRPMRRAGRLATQGIYSLIRHPQTIGAIIALLGLAIIIVPVLHALLAVTPIALAAMSVAQCEDRFLFARFGETHRVYRIRVAAFVPRRVRCRTTLASMAGRSGSPTQTDATPIASFEHPSPQHPAECMP